MSLKEKIKIILQKLNEPDCVITAEKEIKSLIVNEIDDGDKLLIMIDCLGDDHDISQISTKKARYNKLKLFISISEIF